MPDLDQELKEKRQKFLELMELQVKSRNSSEDTSRADDKREIEIEELADEIQALKKNILQGL